MDRLIDLSSLIILRISARVDLASCTLFAERCIPSTLRPSIWFLNSFGVVIVEVYG